MTAGSQVREWIKDNSVETLVSTYIGALDDEEHVANQRVDSILG